MEDLNQSIRKELSALAEENYRIFSMKLLPGKENVLGVRLPLLRKVAKRLAKGNWQSYLQNARDDSMEEIMLQGMTIGYVKTEFRQIKPYIMQFVPKIDCWSVCDSFVGGLKITNPNKEEMWELLQQYIMSKQTYEVRFGVVMLLSYYVDKNYVEKAFALLDKVKHENYYVKMAVAWAISIYYIKLPEQTISYLQQNNLDDFTYNKALQKITESRIPTNEAKNMIRGMKRK